MAVEDGPVAKGRRLLARQQDRVGEPALDPLTDGDPAETRIEEVASGNVGLDHRREALGVGLAIEGGGALPARRVAVTHDIDAPLLSPLFLDRRHTSKPWHKFR